MASPIGKVIPVFGHGQSGVSENWNAEDNEKFHFGTGNDISLSFDGSEFRIKNSSGTNLVSINPSTAEMTIGAGHDNTLLTLSSTDAGTGSGPDFVLHRDSPSPATADLIGVMVFAGDDSAGNYQEYSRVQGRILDPTSGSEEGGIRIAIAKAGSFNVNALDIGSTEIIFNDDAEDIDFRVETTATTNALFVDAGNDVVQTNSPLQIMNTVNWSATTMTVPPTKAGAVPAGAITNTLPAGATGTFTDWLEIDIGGISHYLAVWQ